MFTIVVLVTELKLTQNTKSAAYSGPVETHPKPVWRETLLNMYIVKGLLLLVCNILAPTCEIMHFFYQFWF